MRKKVFGANRKYATGAGKFHIEGKNYIVQDGDMLNIRFNV